MYIYIISPLSKFSPWPLKKQNKNQKTPRENYPSSRPNLFPESRTRPSPELNKIWPLDPKFLLGLNGPVWGSLMVCAGTLLVFSWGHHVEILFRQQTLKQIQNAVCFCGTVHRGRSRIFEKRGCPNKGLTELERIWGQAEKVCNFQS